MRKLLFLFSVLLLQSCLGGFSKLEFVSLENVRLSSISLESASFVASADIKNNSGRVMEISGLEIYSDQLDGVFLSVDSSVVIPTGTNMLQIPAKLTYNTISLLSIIGKLNDSITLKVVIKMPNRSIKLKKKIKTSEFVSFIKSIRK